MRKNFITNISFLLLLNLLIKPFWILGIDRGVQNALGPETYGIYFALFNFSYLFQVVLDFGINNYNNRLVAKSPEHMGTHLFSSLILKLLLSIAYTVIVFIAAVGVQFDGEQLRILGLLVLMQMGLSFYSFLRSNVNALHLFKTDAVLSVLDKLITSIICGLVLWTGITGWTITIPLFIWIQIAGYGTGIIVALIILSRQQITVSMQWNAAQIRTIFRSSFPYALLGFLMTAYYRTDGVMLERMLGVDGPYQAGVYASAFRLLDAMNILGFLFAGLLMPMFARAMEERTPIAPLLQLGFTLMVVCSVAVGIPLLFHRHEVITLLYHQPDPQAGTVFGWLMVSFIAISITYIYGSLITAHGRLRILNIISLTGFVINISLNAILIPQQYAVGSAIATVIAQLIITVAHIYQANKIFPGLQSPKIWFQVLAYLLLASAVSYGCTFSPFGWGLQLLCAVGDTLAAAIPDGILRMHMIPGMIAAMRSALARRTGA